jgi:hypothetical protein
MLYKHKSMTKFNIACIFTMRFSFLYDRKIDGFLITMDYLKVFHQIFGWNSNNQTIFNATFDGKVFSKNYTQVEVFHNKENDEIQNHIPGKALRWMSNYDNHKGATSQKQGLSLMCWEEGLGLQSCRYSNLH